jgi:arsenite methyltransferase
MTGEDVKLAVREKYGQIASEGSSCCGPSCGCGTDTEEALAVIMNDKYNTSHKDIVETADLGLGCGTPTAFADFKQGQTILDLGSGAGIDVFLAARAVGPTGKAIGLDMTPEMISRANANKEKLGIANAEFFRGEIENMPLESGSVDHIISNCVINLVPDKAKAFAEMHRVLRTGGRFTVSDIVTVGSIPEDVRADMLLWAGCVAGAVGKNEYLDIIRAQGFDDVRIDAEKPYSLDPSVPFGLVSITVSAVKA